MFNERRKNTKPEILEGCGMGTFLKAVEREGYIGRL
jgi:hypothetical protein